MRSVDVTNVCTDLSYNLLFRTSIAQMLFIIFDLDMTNYHLLLFMIFYLDGSITVEILIMVFSLVGSCCCSDCINVWSIDRNLRSDVNSDG